jgi:hypothetical protein
MEFLPHVAPHPMAKDRTLVGVADNSPGCRALLDPVSVRPEWMIYAFDADLAL